MRRIIKKIISGPSERAFTLIEAVVATAIFATVVVAMLGIYTSVITLDRKSRSQRLVADNSRFIMDFLSKEVRNGSIDYPSYPLGLTDPDCTIVGKCVDLYIINQAGDSEHIYLDNLQNLVLVKNGGSATNLNSSNVEVTNLKFYVRPQGDPYTSAKLFNQQPFVTVILELTSNNGANVKDNIKIDLEGTFATRIYPSRTSVASSTCSSSPCPVAWWKFDDGSGSVAIDSSGNDNTGTLVNSPTWTTGQINGALSFNGVNQYVDGGSGPTIDNLSARTITAWIKLNSYGESSLGRILDKGTSTGWAFLVNNNDISNGLTFEQGFSVNMGSWGLANVLSTGTWYHVAVVYDSSSTSNVPTFYVNGVAYAPTDTFSSPSGTAVDDSTTSIKIGALFPTQRNFDGILDDVRIYNTALGAADIQAIYNGLE
jgi:hypothetical protein